MKEYIQQMLIWHFYHSIIHLVQQDFYTLCQLVQLQYFVME